LESTKFTAAFKNNLGGCGVAIVSIKAVQGGCSVSVDDDVTCQCEEWFVGQNILAWTLRHWRISPDSCSLFKQERSGRVTVKT